MNSAEHQSSDAQPGSLAEFRAGWRPLVACAFGLGLGLSPIAPYTSGIMATALEGEFGWSRADILGTLMLAPIALVFLGAYVGRLVDRLGPRKVALVSTAGLGLAQLLIALIGGQLLTFYAAWAVLAVISLGTLPMTYAKVINAWFTQSRGLALGLALASTGATGAAIPFLLNAALEAFGWRGGYVLLAALPLVIALPVLFAWLRLPEARARTATEALPQTGIPVRQALRGYRFWVLAVGSMALAFGVSGLLPNLFPLLLDRGVDNSTAASALAALAISVTAGRILSGFLLDRIWAPLVCALLVIPATFALVLLANPALTVPVMVASVVTLGLVAGAEFDLVAYMTARYFGQKHFSELYGIQYAAFGLGAGFAPAFYGAMYDRFGSYQPEIILSIALLLFSVAITFALGRYPTSFSSAPEAAQSQASAHPAGEPRTA